MDEYGQQGGTDWSAWGQAVIGTAISAYVDREIRGPQGVYDPGQAYGVGDDGRLYTLGQTNSQISANVTPAYGNGGGLFGGNMLPLLIIGAVIFMAAK
ncbi:MAG: hypothetical protein ACXW2U_00785 [Telluria sp.]